MAQRRGYGMVTKFANTGETISSFADEFLVRCPRCGQCAFILPLRKADGSPNINRRRLTCTHCTYVNEWHGPAGIIKYRATPDYDLSGILIGAPVDWFFQQPLWLQTPCCGETLWAYNHRHLAYLEDYVQAGLRDEGSPGRRGLASKLPHWMKSAKNRDEVLRCLSRLKTL